MKQHVAVKHSESSANIDQSCIAPQENLAAANAMICSLLLRYGS
jgi:hypothetical protein